MPYGIIRKLLTKEFYGFGNAVLIESPFEETTRLGQYLRSVVLAVTPTKLIIACKRKSFENPLSLKSTLSGSKVLEIQSMYHLEMIKITVFKQTRRQSLKVHFQNNTIRYFDLSQTKNRTIFWKLWCNQIQELNKESKLWPFCNILHVDIAHSKTFWDTIDCIKIRNINDENEKKSRLKWTEKYLYLGSEREAEDNSRPAPIPGLGPTEEIQLLYLKPRYFGCWEQSEHWVQCGGSVPEATCDYNVYTYTGGPTSNVTYTSLMTTVCNTYHYFVQS